MSGLNGHAHRLGGTLDALPPHNIEAERGVLGSILLDDGVLGSVLEVLEAEDFFRDTHQVIFRGMLRLRDRGIPIDAITLSDELERGGEFDGIGGDDAFAEILDCVPHAANARHYADIVRQKAIGRKLLEDADAIIRDVRSNRFAAEDLVETARERVGSIRGGRGDGAAARRPWPEKPHDDIWHGLAGDIVALIEPHSEADPVAILAQLLVGFGSIVGRRPYWSVEATRHGCNLFLCVVGNSSKARKGTSWDHVRRLLGMCDPAWEADRVLGGLSSGEGMIWAVRDPIYRRERVAGVPELGGGGHQEVMVDPGVDDKRVLFIETEFGSTLAALGREGNTLNGHLRQAWDGVSLRSLTKNNPAKSTGAHVAIIGHITVEELHHRLTLNDAFNGFSNRFLWLCARRSKYLPRGGRIHEVNFDAARRRLEAAVAFATAADPFAPEGGSDGRRIELDPSAGRHWDRVYPGLSDARPGVLGAVTSRAEAQVRRIAAIYALLDCSEWIELPHLRAALALWSYCDQSAASLFGDSLGDPDAEKVLAAIRAAGPAGVPKTELRRTLFANHARATERLAAAFAVLDRAGLIAERKDSDRKSIIWTYTGNPGAESTESTESSPE